jgi:hypothetical protein
MPDVLQVGSRLAINRRQFGLDQMLHLMAATQWTATEAVLQTERLPNTACVPFAL